ncbi:MAG TPA: carboxypeptidase-like regulatory domain-containing protein, partial [Puia sp.]
MKLYIGIVMLACFHICHAQVKNYAEIRNQDGLVVSGATIHVLNTDISVISNTAGQFTFPDLPKGIYAVEISSIGYAKIQ